MPRRCIAHAGSHDGVLDAWIDLVKLADGNRTAEQNLLEKKRDLNVADEKAIDVV